MNTKTVIMWGREDPVSWAVEYSLAGHEEREVIRIAEEKSLAEVLRLITETRPGAIIIHPGDHGGNALQPMQILMEHPELKVIVLSLENNSMEVYNRKKVCIQKLADLVSAVEE